MIDLLSTVKRAIGVSGDYEEYEEEYYEEDEREADLRHNSNTERYESRGKGARGVQPKVVSMPSEQTERKVVVVSPSCYDDARSVCDNLKAWAPVIVKLDNVDREEAQRVIDFIMGACYTLDGHVQEIKEDVFLVAPSVVNIEKDMGDPKAIKSGSFFSKFL